MGPPGSAFGCHGKCGGRDFLQGSAHVGWPIDVNTIPSSAATTQSAVCNATLLGAHPHRSLPRPPGMIRCVGRCIDCDAQRCSPITAVIRTHRRQLVPAAACRASAARVLLQPAAARSFWSASTRRSAMQHQQEQHLQQQQQRRRQHRLPAAAAGEGEPAGAEPPPKPKQQFKFCRMCGGALELTLPDGNWRHVCTQARLPELVGIKGQCLPACPPTALRIAGAALVSTSTWKPWHGCQPIDCCFPAPTTGRSASTWTIKTRAWWWAPLCSTRSASCCAAAASSRSAASGPCRQVGAGW